MRKLGNVPAYQSGELLHEDIKRTVVPPGLVALWNIGQVGTVMKTPVMADGKARIIAIDPYLTRSIETNSPGTEFVREYNPPLEPEALGMCDAVFITHHHADHLDTETISRIHQSNANVLFVVPTPHIDILVDCGVCRDSIIGAVADEKRDITGLVVMPIAAAHTEYELDAHGNHVFLGYSIQVETGTSEVIRIYHSGDTVITQELLQQVQSIQPHVALLPINGGDYFRTNRNIVGNMNAREAVEFAKTMGADLLIPNHYDMFPNNRDNPAHFVDYLFHEYPEQKFHMLAVGERFIYMP